MEAINEFSKMLVKSQLKQAGTQFDGQTSENWPVGVVVVCSTFSETN